jgi:MFS family permease
MILWGLTSAAMMFAYDVLSFYILRFMLGVFEAGFAVGAVFCFTLWYLESRMSRTLAIFMSAPLLAGLMISPISTYLMVQLSGIGGLKGWQWLFLAECLPCVVLGVIIFFALADTPETARWLSLEEKNLLKIQISKIGQHVQTSFFQALKDVRVYAMAFSLFCLACGISVPFFWLPTILKNAGVTNLMHIGMLTAVAYLFAIIVKFILGISSDYYLERRWHGALSALLGAFGLSVAAISNNHLIMSLFSITCVMAFVSATYNVFMAMVSDYLKNNAAAGGIAFITSISTFGGFISPSIMGWAKTVTGNFQSGLFIMSGLLLMGCFSIAFNRLPK